jgi:hypothetical protein
VLSCPAIPQRIKSIARRTQIRAYFPDPLKNRFLDLFSAFSEKNLHRAARGVSMTACPGFFTVSKGPVMLRAGLGAVLAVALVAEGAAASQVGPIGTYYLTDYSNKINGASTLDAIQGTNIVLNHSISQYQEGAIAVFPGLGVVRTLGASNGYVGGEYGPVPSLTVSPVGPTYTDNDGVHSWNDSTTNGSVNFLVDQDVPYGGVYTVSTTYSGTPHLLFATGDDEDVGITYDATNNSLWIQDWSTGVITDYSMAGTVLTSFATVGGMNHDGYFSTALAMDVDHTLWFDDYGAGTIEHYTTTGTYLGSVHYAGLGYALGGEIGAAATPDHEWRYPTLVVSCVRSLGESAG